MTGSSAEAVAAWSSVMDTHSDISLEWGPTNVDRFLGDPKRIAFFMSRYKFAARMLESCASILDVGCGDGMGTLVFVSDTHARHIVGIDWEKRCIDHAAGKLLGAFRKARPHEVEGVAFACYDFLETMCSPEIYDGICSLDVIEHIAPEQTREFISRLAIHLKAAGVAVVGTPNITASEYASRHSQAGHINLFTADRLREAMSKSFRRVFIFGMNDEVVHTGFLPMAHYLIAVGVK